MSKPYRNAEKFSKSLITGSKQSVNRTSITFTLYHRIKPFLRRFRISTNCTKKICLNITTKFSHRLHKWTKIPQRFKTTYSKNEHANKNSNFTAPE